MHRLNHAVLVRLLLGRNPPEASSLGRASRGIPGPFIPFERDVSPIERDKQVREAVGCLLCAPVTFKFGLGLGFGLADVCLSQLPERHRVLKVTWRSSGGKGKESLWS